MELIIIFLSVTALWLAGGLLAGAMVAFVLFLLWLGVVGIRNLMRRIAFALRLSGRIQRYRMPRPSSTLRPLPN